MITEKSLIDSALRGWKSNVEQADKLFGALSPDQLEQEVAPGRNRLIYLWGHLAAANDGLLPLLGIGEGLHPELDEMFISNQDKSVQLTWEGSQVVYEHHFDEQQSDEPLTLEDLHSQFSRGTAA